MSFSRAPLKRFNEHVGCAPPPGSYEITPGELKGAASFNKSSRFKHIKAVPSGPPPTPSPIKHTLMSPVRRTVSVDGLIEGSSTKKDKNAMTIERKQYRLLENEIRSLVQQRGEQDRRLLSLEEDLKKVEAKLLAAVREKTGLAANVTTLERERIELKKVNEFLKNKVSADTTKKRINSLTMELMEARNNLDSKSKDINVLQITTEVQLKALETDLQAARDTVKALKDKNKDLDDLHQMTKSQNEELENENARLHAVIQELREEVRVLQGYLDRANDQIQDLHLQLQEKTQTEAAAGSQVEKIKQLETESEQCTAKLESTEDMLRQKEEEAQRYHQELLASQEALLEVENRLKQQEFALKSSQKLVSDLEAQVKLADQEVQDSQATVCQQETELARLREVLRRTERELDERVAHLEQRCLFSEEERSKTQEEGLRRVEELRTELILLKDVKRDEKKRQIQLQQEHATLTEELTKEKALVDSLSVLIEQEREDSEERFRQLKEEMEEVLGELALMEEQEQKRLEDLGRWQEGNVELERQLSETHVLLDSKSHEVSTLKEEHFAAVREFQEAHTNSLSKMGDIVNELDRTKEALRGAEDRRNHLEVEVERVTQQMKEMETVIQQKEEEIQRVKEELVLNEEKAEMLLEVQTHLRQKEEEMKAMEASHTALISQLQQELQLQKKAKEEALGQIEKQKGQSDIQLQTEKEKAQELLQVCQEKEEIMGQLLREQEERGKIEMALEQESNTLEVERKAHQQTRSEGLRLENEVERLHEERKGLLSQVELSDQSRLALQDQLAQASQDRSELQSHLDELVSQLVLLEEKTQALQCELEEQRRDRRALQQQVEAVTQEKVTLQWEMEEQRQELGKQLTEAQEKSSLSSETESWKKQYEELLAKVKPFQEQLNSFAAERNALLNENGANQEELNKLADAYARLLGHQNQKQKIKHIMKLKDENISLKQELLKLRSQVGRQKSDLELLRSKLPGTPRRRFDPSKAFQHNKENRKTETPAPLKEGNRC
ncbi:hyaluronan mediated motility receptor [Aulostomus maculatus]